MKSAQQAHRQLSLFQGCIAGWEADVRIYFHLKSAQKVLLDAEGVEVSDPQEARVQAARLIEELRPQEAQYWSGWTLTATDAAGRVLFAVDPDSGVWS